MSECYSHNHENWYTDENDAIHAAVEEAKKQSIGPQLEEYTVTIYKGDLICKAITAYVPDIADSIMDNAFDEGYECIIHWLDDMREHKKALQDIIEKAVDDYANAHGLQPDFGDVVNIQEQEVDVTIDKDGEWDYTNKLL